MIDKKVISGINCIMAFPGYLLRSDRALGNPVALSIEPTNVCNLHCPLCATGSNSLTRPKGYMSLDNFKTIVDMLPNSITTLYLWGQGEPFMAPDFLRMVHHASVNGFKTITSTNGHFLDDPYAVVKSGLNVLIVSLDGINADTYASYRKNGDFHRVIKGIKCLAEEIKKENHGPVIELQCLATEKNVNQMEAFKSLASSIGAHHVIFKTLQALSMKNRASYLPSNLNYTRYRRNAQGNLETDRRWFLKNRCLRLYYSFQIDWQGNVLPCCFDKDSVYIMGNVFQDSISKIWNSDKYRSFRNKLNSMGRVLPMCRDCTEGLKKITLHV
ncbi:MAG TPA: radical SAM protein [Anaerolineae bacterium]|nr:radical SAM protein [Anaerolineae bacterium]